MTKKKKTKMPAKSPSAYDRFYPKVEKLDTKKRSKKNDATRSADVDKSADKKIGVPTEEV